MCKCSKNITNKVVTAKNIRVIMNFEITSLNNFGEIWHSLTIKIQAYQQIVVFKSLLNTPYEHCFITSIHIFWKYCLLYSIDINIYILNDSIHVSLTFGK